MMDTDQENRRSTRQRRPPTHLQQYHVESVGFGKPQEPCTTHPRPSATHLKPGGRGITNPASAQQQSDLKELQDEVCSLKETIKLLVDRMGSLHICNRDSESVNVSEDCISSDDDFDVDYSQPVQRPHSCVEFQCSIPEENRARSSCSAPSRLALPHPASQSSFVQPQPLIAPQSSVVPTHNPQSSSQPPQPQPAFPSSSVQPQVSSQSGVLPPHIPQSSSQPPQPQPAFPSSSVQPQVSSQSGVLPPHIPQSSSQPPQPQPAFPSSSVQPQVSSQSAVFPPHIPQSSSQPSSQPPQHYPASPSSSLQSQPQPHTAFQSGFLLPCNLQSNFQPAQSYPAPQFDLPTPADSQSNPLPPLALQPGLLVQPAPQPIPSVQPAPVSNLYVPPLPGLQLPTAPVHSFYAPQAHYTNSPSQTPVTSHYSSRIVTPSFPDFRSDDPYEFIMLKMALDNLVPPYESEMFKYHVLLDHLLLPSARYIALSYAHDPQPYTKSVAALEQQYGQPHHLALREISSILQLPRIRPGDSKGFHAFALRVQSLVGMLQSLGPGAGTAELSCSSHVQQLLSKLPTDQIANYARYAQLHHPHVQYNLMHFSAWLQGEAQCQALASGVLVSSEYTRPARSAPIKSFKHFDNAMPMLLIGADNTYLITAIEEVRAGPPGTPVAIHTRLGWTLQGPTYLHKAARIMSCQPCLKSAAASRSHGFGAVQVLKAQLCPPPPPQLAALGQRILVEARKSIRIRVVLPWSVPHLERELLKSEIPPSHPSLTGLIFSRMVKGPCQWARNLHVVVGMRTITRLRKGSEVGVVLSLLVLQCMQVLGLRKQHMQVQGRPELISVDEPRESRSAVSQPLASRSTTLQTWESRSAESQPRASRSTTLQTWESRSAESQPRASRSTTLQTWESRSAESQPRASRSTTLRRHEAVARTLPTYSRWLLRCC
ncbi:uncharacterized protein LOC125784529 [Astyanax mexicanus]|uniref:uncharacterized protein LOC125784529 n=1 Tax=Astyanax mexicanus TaxID=7994 RepID=UPI0020CAEBB8|nr:uncharacterized protein LOC125784529 [Astyanax mexicanus]